MGATNTQIICKVLLPEAMPGILAGLTIAFVALVGSSAMAGAVGGGGLGDMGIRYGYQRFMPEVMAAVVIILIVLRPKSARASAIGWSEEFLTANRSPTISNPAFFSIRPGLFFLRSASQLNLSNSTNKEFVFFTVLEAFGEEFFEVRESLSDN